MNKLELKTIDLFAGVGGLRQAFEGVGFKTVFANDNEINCSKTYNQNFSIPKLHIQDIREINPHVLPNFDVLVAGFPCQSFSVAGYREGFNDKKGRG